MRPVRTRDCNIVYKGPSQEVGDLWCHRVRPGLIRTTWEPDAEQRELLAAGGRIQLTIMREPISPVMLTVVSAEESKPVGPHGWKIDVEPGDRLNPPEEPDPEPEEPTTQEETNGEHAATSPEDS